MFKSKYIYASLLCLFISYTCYAEEPDNEEEFDDDIEVSQVEVETDGSPRERLNTVSLILGASPYYLLPPTIGIDLQRGLHIPNLFRSKWILGINFTKSDSDITGLVKSAVELAELENLTVHKAHLKNEALFFYGKYPVGKVFSWLGSGLYSKIGIGKMAFNGEFQALDGKYLVEFEAESWAALLSFGHHWVFDNGLSLEFEWLGISQPMVGKTIVQREQRLGSLEINDFKFKQLIRDNLNFIDGTKLHLFLGLGYAF